MDAAPLVLDFDDSVLKFSDNEIRIPLQHWQEQLRFGCAKAMLERFEKTVTLPEKHGCVFLGSGDYHHLSLTLLRKAAEQGDTFTVVVFDNHPDNMRYPFGIHCGSWVYHASRLPQVEHIHVVGITSGDITGKHCWENYLSPLRNNQVTYWSIGKDTGWMRWIGLGSASRNFSAPDALMNALEVDIMKAGSVYLSIDKDVFGKEVVETNWDQGCLEFAHVGKVIDACRNRLVGMDVTGEVSAYTFQGWFKKLLVKLDGLEEPEPSMLGAWQDKQRDINKMIVERVFSEKEMTTPNHPEG